MNTQIQALMNFLDASHSVYHAAACLAKTLDDAGYTRLAEKDHWKLIPGGKY